MRKSAQAKTPTRSGRTMSSHAGRGTSHWCRSRVRMRSDALQRGSASIRLSMTMKLKERDSKQHLWWQRAHRGSKMPSKRQRGAQGAHIREMSSWQCMPAAGASDEDGVSSRRNHGRLENVRPARGISPALGSRRRRHRPSGRAQTRGTRGPKERETPEALDNNSNTCVSRTVRVLVLVHHFAACRWLIRLDRHLCRHTASPTMTKRRMAWR